MPLLSTSEALHVSDSFLSSLYGDDIFRRWKELKDEMKFLTEREYVSWLIDVANHYNRNEDLSQQLLSQETHTNHVETSNMKNEEGLDHYNQGQGKTFKNPATEYSHLSSTHDTSSSKNHSEQLTVDTKVEGAGNSNEQPSVTSQVDDYKTYEQSQYDNVREDDGVLEMERGEEITLSDNEGGEGANGTIDDGNGVENAARPARKKKSASQSSGGSCNKRHKCPNCSYSSNRVDSMKRHVTAVHERRKLFSCQHCDYHCSQSTHLKGHLVYKHGYTSKYCCNRCGKYFHVPKQWQKHISMTTCN